MRAALVLGILCAQAAILAQSGPATAGVGYSAPGPIKVSPGQVVTIFLHTQQKLESPIRHTGLPWPLSLGPFSAVLSQTASADGIPVPLQSAAPVEVCSGPVPRVCASLTAITVQIPFELLPNSASTRLPENLASLTVFESGEAGRPIALDPSASQIHIIGSCDSTESSVVTPCVPEVHHADGTYVTSQQPAVPGETLEILAYGLGRGDAPMPTGFGAPSPPVAVGDVYVGLKFGQNLAPSAPPVDSVAEVQMTPAAVGLYRIRFVVPPVPDDAPACSAVGSNLTVSVSRASSLVGAGICVYQVDAQTNPVAPPIRPR